MKGRFELPPPKRPDSSQLPNSGALDHSAISPVSREEAKELCKYIRAISSPHVNCDEAAFAER
jgi:hypothetical protein